MPDPPTKLVQRLRRAKCEILESWLLLPTSAYVLALVSAVLSVVLVLAAGRVVPETYVAVPDRDSTEERCVQRSALRSPWMSTCCSGQLRERARRIGVLDAEISQACKRWGQFKTDLEYFDPLTRQGLREEEAEIRRVFKLWRDLAGAEPAQETRLRAWLLGVSVLAGIASMLGASRQARSADIKRLENYRSILVPIAASATFTCAVAAYVTYRGSLDVHKTGYDWTSYCLAGPLQIGGWSSTWAPGWSFWLAHAPLGFVSVLVALQIATGWHMTSPGSATPDAWKPGWGVSRYVEMLQTWTFVIVVMVGLISAIWLRTLTSSPTDVMSFFLGFGALVPIAWLVCRFIRCGLTLRDECAAIRGRAVQAREDPRRDAAGSQTIKPEKPKDVLPDADKLPADPTDGLLSRHWWQVPALFLSALGAASALLRWAGLEKLTGP